MWGRARKRDASGRVNPSKHKDVVSVDVPEARLVPEALVEAVLDLKHCWGYCYTQLTDVEQECNGIFLYDRSEKFDMDRIRTIFSRSRASA